MGWSPPVIIDDQPRRQHIYPAIFLDYIGYGNRDPLNAKVIKIWPTHHDRRV